MRYDSDVSTRRILTSPAVYPCEDTSPATLLASLIDLATDICGCQPESLPTNKRNARETIRQVGLILVFLQEAHETRPDLPDPAMLSLSELHVAFQKIRYLTEDCAREGARSWLVMESERVADQFQQLIRGVATALDVLRLDGIDVAAEVKEVAELVRRQSREARVGMERNDERLRSEVGWCLNGFSNGVAPDSGDLRNTLLDLGIRCWSDCDREIKFLEEEIRLETTMSPATDAGGRQNLWLLTGLLGFMSYCRCVLFDHVGHNRAASSATAAVRETATLNCLDLDADLFLCPISLEIMSDPVTVTATGQTYDRSSILRWIRAGNSTCPRTGEKLTHIDLVPNLVVRHLVRQFCASTGIPTAELSSTTAKKAVPSMESPAAQGAAKMAARFLASRFVVGTVEEREKAAFEIRLLTKRSVVSRSCLVDAGTIPHLLGLLSSEESQVREDSMAALLNLSKHPLGRAQIVENGGLKLIVHALKKKGPKLEVQQLAAAALYYLASVEEYRKLIGETPEAIPALVELVRNGTQHGKKNAIVTILNLLMHHGNHGRVLAAGAVPELVRVSTSSQREDLVTDSLAALSCLAETTDDGTAAILSERGALQLIVVIFGSTASRLGKEHCVSLLLALSINGGRDVVSVLVKNHHLMELLYSQLAEGTSRASKKASALIRLLHAFSERDSNSLVTPAAAIQHDRFVHVW